MPMRTRSLLSVLTLAAVAAAQASPERAAAHYAVVEAELRAAPAPLDPLVAARRLHVIELLREYRERGVFGIDPRPTGARVPRFVDDHGRRCAVANLLDHTGHGALTLAIQMRQNDAWIADLVGDGALRAWLAMHGLTAAEAARIQVPGSEQWGGRPPEEPPPPAEKPEPPDWRPADAPTAGANGGGGAASGAAARTGGAGATPGATAGRIGGGPRTPRGVTIDSLGAPTWFGWWQWNRGQLELPEPVAPTTTTRTRSVADARHREALALLELLTAAPSPVLRAAAVLAAGRAGATSEATTAHFADDAREVRLMALLALGSGSSAAHGHALASRIAASTQSETLAVAFAGMALASEGSAGQRLFADTLIRHLRDPRPAVHTAAALAAAAHPSDAIREAARTVASGDAEPLHRAATLALLAHNATDADLGALTRLANDGSLDVRRAAAQALGRSRHALALPALQTAFELEPEMGARAALLHAIGDHGGDAGGAFLRTQLLDGSKQLRASAALGLGLWGRPRDAATRTDLSRDVATAAAAERNRDQQGAYLLALGLLRDAASGELLTRELAGGQTSGTRGAAAAALGLLRDGKALAALHRAATTDSCPGVRAQAAGALGRLGAVAVAPLAQVMRDDKDALVQRDAAWALGGIADARAFDALRALAANDSAPDAARAGAAMGLGRYCRRTNPTLPGLRFQRDHAALPDIVAWAFAQEL
jgi:HEAT repeat protein